MTSLSTTQITIDRAYFDTLVRRAKFNSDSLETQNVISQNVSISQSEYDRLRLIARQYENLRRNLLRGGVGEDTVDLLSKDDATIQEGPDDRLSQSRAQADDEGGARLDAGTPQPKSAFVDQPRTSTDTYMNDGHGHGHGHENGIGNMYHGRYHPSHPDHTHHNARPSWADKDPDDEEGSIEGDFPLEGPAGASLMQTPPQKPQFDRQCTRTVQLMNLPEGTTHGDITSVVRGGLLLDVFLRIHDRAATVSFLHASDARRFYEHVRRRDLYLKKKRIDIRWADRQFILPGHVASKIAIGASRNLVIRRVDTKHTEESIRDDLDHIHNLVVVKIEFIGGNCYISLNSVHNAIYARMCMMSRFKYRGSKIEWDVDECAQPYVRVPQMPPQQRKESAAQSKPGPVSGNRFQLLKIDDSDSDEIATAFQSKKSVGIAA